MDRQTRQACDRGGDVSYDTKCYDLAKAFIDDASPALLAKRDPVLAAAALAQVIQDAIEDYLSEWES